MAVDALEFIGADNDGADFFIIEATAPMSPGVSRPKGFRFIYYAVNPLVDAFDFANLYQSVFGNLGKPNDILFLRITPIGATGLATTPLITKLTLSA